MSLPSRSIIREKRDRSIDGALEGEDAQPRNEPERTEKEKRVRVQKAEPTALCFVGLREREPADSNPSPLPPGLVTPHV